MKIITSSKTNRRGFTLIELLVVITIIGILAGFMFPVASGVQRRAQKSDAENTAHNLKNAISAYNTEYRKYPVKDPGNADQTLQSDNTLMDPLLAADDNELNPRNIVFFSGRQARPAGSGAYRKGVKLSANGGGELWDPYAQYYSVALDTDYNNRIATPSWEKSDSPMLPATILVWSAGADKSDDEAKDNIKTW